MMNLTLAICVYNAERYIVETLESVMKQTRQGFELLIVNDCSTDGCVEKIRAFFEQNPRQYKLVEFEENRGIGYARHFAERYAKTRYMMFLDADDVLYPNAIEVMYDKITSDEDLMAVGCYLEYMDSKGKKMRGGIFLGEKTKKGFYEKAEHGKLIFMQPTAIYDREEALRVGGYVIDGYPEGKPRYQDYCEDLDLWTRMSDFYVGGKAIVVVPQVLCRYRKGGGLSSNSFNMTLKMRYTKTNVRRRRRGEKDLTFVEFYDSLSTEELKQLKRDSVAADSLRNAVFYLYKWNVVMFVWLILKSVWNKPSYIWDKVRCNLRIF